MSASNGSRRTAPHFYYCNRTKETRKSVSWQLCSARKIPNHVPNEPIQYHVQMINAENIHRNFFILSEHELAYRELEYKHQPRARVIAKRDPNLLPYIYINENKCDYVCQQDYGQFYAGIVTDSIFANETHLYLVFFDDGHVQYVAERDIRNVLGKFSWNGVSENLRTLISYYDRIESNDVRTNFTKFAIDTTVKVELNGRWQWASIKEKFGKLILLRYFESNYTEWMYCKSPRIEDAWRLLNSDQRFKECIMPVVCSSYVVETEDDCKPLTENVILGQLRKPAKHFSSHKCGPSCLSNVEREYDLSVVFQLYRPLAAGWKRIPTDDAIKYIAPCGRSHSTLTWIHKYLTATKSKIGIDCFCFDQRISCEKFFSSRNGQNIRKSDLSRGLERMPIPIVGSSRYPMPKRFDYVTRTTLSDVVPKILYNPYRKVCCDCTDDCADKSKCACWQYNMRIVYKQMDKLYEYKRLENHNDIGIYECHSGCKCVKNCFNRVAQQPLQQNVELFHTEKCGWGIRTLNDIPRGTFLSNYLGDILSGDEADIRTEQTGNDYIFDLRIPADKEVKKMKKMASNEDVTMKTDGFIDFLPLYSIDLNTTVKDFLIDAKMRGNFVRFLNHSCDPNMFVQEVYIDTHDNRFPRLALFSKRNIEAGEELTIDYGYQPGSIQGRSINCQCGARDCRKKLL